uniref:NADH-ubiquinone oxidoreductase chain 5 n=1 Tax=Triatoma dimidiata TaxID=72491 RepID=Q9G804_TRIDM|nr:NADH dehydrogenase subunit 5 [Triatoma dimidiata]AAG31614.1 NADH dehydrogenase subuint 5 [Triatoma dimidiata]QSH91001.1 NADH dehydrogenase subunit 5 [Triatoma dimidiata]
MLNKWSVYLLGSLILFLTGMLFFMIGSLYLIWDYVVFMDWEILSLNSCVVTMTLLFDWMSLVFVGCVFIISSMVIYYSESYMGSDFDRIRFYFLVILFVMSMMMMIVSPNLMSILIGWDGLGLVSYCLVIYFQNYKSYSAGMLTILTNRVGDVAILLSIAWMLNYGSWHYIYYMGMWDFMEFYLVSLIILAGFTSSAQIPFSSWLPAAMAAPTPVSSLVHSSTLVTAGVYLLIRFSDLILNLNCSLVLTLSMMTMFMAGLGANFEFDLSKIIALSTLSQLGLMMSILFIGYPVLAFLHLLTHAFFKALLFLCAGLMIHCMSDSQDIRHMGLMVNHLPFTCTCFCISNMSLCGMPFMSGFYSKDIILEMMMVSGYNFFVFMIFFLSIGLTVSYTFRVIYYTLFYHINVYSCQSYTEDGIMMKSMIVLSVLAIFGGSMLSWMVFSVPFLVVLPLFLKLMPLTFIFLGGWLGYELSVPFLGGGLLSERFYFVSFFSGSMWFMPYFSTSMIYGKSFYVSSGYLEVMDGGWGEYLVSNSFLFLSSLISSMMNYYQFNNVSIFMMVFILIVIFSLI